MLFGVDLFGSYAGCVRAEHLQFPRHFEQGHPHPRPEFGFELSAEQDNNNLLGGARPDL